MYDLEDFATAMDYLADGLVDGIAPDELVTRCWLDRIGHAFARSKTGQLTSLQAVLDLCTSSSPAPLHAASSSERRSGSPAAPAR
jgi:hypothetical protein